MRLVINTTAVLVTLFVFSLVGAVIFPTLPTVNNILSSGLTELLFFLFSLLILMMVGTLVGKGARGIKSPIQSLGLAYMGALIIGGVLGLFTYLNFPFSIHINFAWLGTSWYSPWLTVFLIGAPLMLVFMM